MKKILVTTIFLLLLFIMPTMVKGQTSTYHAFPDSAAQWNFRL